MVSRYLEIEHTVYQLCNFNPHNISAIQCSPLSPISHGQYNQFSCTTRRMQIRDVCVPECEDGYQLINSESALCLDSGTWNKTTAAECQGIDYVSIIIEHDLKVFIF